MDRMSRSPQPLQPKRCRPAHSPGPETLTRNSPPRQKRSLDARSSSGMSLELPPVATRAPLECLLRFKRIIARLLYFASRFLHPNTGGIMATQPLSNQHDELVEVFGSKEESEVMVVRGLLEAAGIDALVTSLEAPQDVLPGVGGLVVKVPADQAEEARRVINEERR